jgi:hypothetical protein
MLAWNRDPKINPEEGHVLFQENMEAWNSA